MDQQKLIRMAEQITLNMTFTDDEAVVATKVADHLQRFWDPRMRAAIQAYVSEHPELPSAVLSRALEMLN
jgi:formate dehydrogenase subunit delta